jgi:ankyrin repeat protein
LAKSVFLHKDWGEKRKNYREWSTQKELKIILYCCKHGDEDMYFKLRKKYNVNINYQCLLLAIKCGSYIIVEDILESISADITDDKKCKCMELALLKFAEKPMKKRTKVINVLQRFVPVDYKVKGVDPVIHTATKDGNGFVIVALEYFKGDINLINVHGKTILHEAVLKNRAAFLDIALKHGADQKKADKHGLLPIHECARHNKPYMLRLLVKSDGEILCATDSSGRQPLHHAAINSSFEAATCLISHGVDVNVVDDKKRTPLHYAAESGKGTVIHSLLEANANTTKQDGDGQSPWIIACKSQNIEGIKRLLEDEKIDVNKPIDNLFPIHMVAATGNISTIKRLVGKGANINEVTLDTNDTVLHIAIKHGHDKLVENLLEMDDSLVDFKNKRNEVPLHTAAQYGNFFATNALLKAGADRSVINRKCQKPLCLAKQKLGEQTKEEDYEKYLSVYRLLDGHKTRRETAV